MHGPVEVLCGVRRTAGTDERLAKVVQRAGVVRVGIHGRLEALDGPFDVARHVGMLPREQLGNGRTRRAWHRRRRGWWGKIRDGGLNSSRVCWR